jgi:hypothetical protein
MENIQIFSILIIILFIYFLLNENKSSELQILEMNNDLNMFNYKLNLNNVCKTSYKEFKFNEEERKQYEEKRKQYEEERKQYEEKIRNEKFDLNNVCKENYNDFKINEEKKRQDEEEIKKQKKELSLILKQQKELTNSLLLNSQDNLQDIAYLFDLKNNCYGDDKLTNKMIHMSLKNKHAINNRASWDKNSFLPFVKEELYSHENSVWWENDVLDDELLDNNFLNSL